MFSEGFFVTPRRGVLPDGFHLFAAVFGFHVGIVEEVVGTFAFLCLGCPVDEFCRVGKGSATEIGWRIRFLPDDVVE